MTDVKLDSNDHVLLDQAVSHIEERVEILREAEPYLIDMSAREATLSSYVGHTLDDKIALYEMSRDLGFHDLAYQIFSLSRPSRMRSSTIWLTAVNHSNHFLRQLRLNRWALISRFRWGRRRRKL